MAGNPGDMFGDLFGSSNPFLTPPKKKGPEKGPNGGWRAKIIKDEHYVPMSQVVELLSNNEILPGMRKRLEDHISAHQAKVAAEAVMPTIEGVETGLCSGEVGRHHPFCIVGDHQHEAHFVEVTKGG